MKPRRLIEISMLSIGAAIFLAACLFFAYYTLRLVYINVTDTAVRQHRQAGMYIGAVAFPVAAVLFGWISFRCGRLVGQRVRANRSSAV
jgi:hypothetical protein